MRRNGKRDKEYLIHERPLKALIVFALPMIVGNLFQQFYTMVDSMVVGRYVGEGALAAVGAAYSLTNVFICVAIGGGMGASVVVSQYFGARAYGKMRKAISTALISFLILSVLLGVAGFWASPAIMELLKTPGDILDMAVAYVRIYFLGLPFLFLYNVLSAMFNAVGRSRIPLYLLIFSSLLNIALDIFMVRSLGMGVEGVAWATLIAQGLSAVISFLLFWRMLLTISAADGADADAGPGGSGAAAAFRGSRSGVAPDGSSAVTAPGGAGAVAAFCGSRSGTVPDASNAGSPFRGSCAGAAPDGSNAGAASGGTGALLRRLYSPAELKSMSRIAFPSILQQSTVSIGMMLVQSVVNGFGTQMLAGFSAAMRVESICVVPMSAIGNAISSYTAQNIGARSFDRVNEGYHRANGMVIGFALIICAALELFHRDIVLLFLGSDGTDLAIQTGSAYLQFMGWFFALIGFKMAADGLLRGAGDMKLFTIANLTNLTFRVVFALAMAPRFGIQMVWYAVPIGWFLNFIISYSRYRTGKWRTRHL